jgi:capsular exopolysaccharide synthesis family protein
VELTDKDDLSSQAMEAFNTLRTNIQFSGDHVKAIIVTSCTPNEGKSFTSFRLARSFAEAGKSVLFIDGDMRKSAFSGRYHVSAPTCGLSHLLSGQKSEEETIYPTNINRLDVVFSGPSAPNPSALLSGDAFSRLIALARAHYDYIIIDSPPLGPFIDSALMAPSCDGAVLVIESGVTHYRLAQGVKEQFEKSGCRFLGVVLNKADAKHDPRYGYGSYYSQYGKYGSY